MTAKYRPYLSLDQITRILGFLESTPPLDSELIKSLRLILLKAGQGLNSPAYVPASPKPRIDAKSLGFSESPPIKIDHRIKRKELYNAYTLDPLKEYSLEDMESIETYMFENELMSPEKETEYLNKLGI
jgi:hypothetical protein